MTPPFSSDHARGWLGTLWPVLQSASPLTVLLLLVLWWLSIHWMAAEVARVHAVNQQLWQELVAAQQVQIDLARHCPPPEGR